MKLLSQKVLFLLMMAVPIIGVAQPGGPGGGGSPDEPLDTPVVPFDNNLNFIFLLVSIVFAVLVYKRLQKSKEKVHK